MPLTQVLHAELLASSRVEGKRQGCEKPTWAPTTSLVERNTYVPYSVLIVTTRTAEETEALESWLMHPKAHGYKWEWGIHANLVPGITKAYVFLSHQENQWWTRGFAGF